MNKRRLGNVLQNKVEQILTKQGYIVHNQKPVAKPIPTGRGLIWVSQRNDIFGCIDIIAMHPSKKIKFIQVTADTGVKRKGNELDKINWNKRHAEIELWRYTGKGRWIIYELNKENVLEKKLEFYRGKFLPYGGKE
jgi:hypothetical protein